MAHTSLLSVLATVALLLGASEGVRGASYCEGVIELYEILEDPEYDLNLSDIGSDEAEKDFARVWLRFDEFLLDTAPNREIFSALVLISRHVRSVVGASNDPPNLIEYAEALGLVIDFHLENCLPPEQD